MDIYPAMRRPSARGEIQFYHLGLTGSTERNGTTRDMQVKFLVRLSELDLEISMLSLSTLIGFPLDIISKCTKIFSKPTEPKVSSGIHYRSYMTYSIKRYKLIRFSVTFSYIHRQQCERFTTMAAYLGLLL